MVKRDLYLKQISSLIDKDIIKVITGVRRCGKSYMFNLIIKELIDRGIPESNIFLINFESRAYYNVRNSRELDLLLDGLLEGVTGRIYLFFDEIQHVDGWERSVNGYRVDYDCDIFITGSNSKLLSGELATLLTGRYMEIKMYPFSYNEFLDYKNYLPGKKSFEEYLLYGGFPFALSLEDNEKKLEYLIDLFNSIFYKDLISRYQIRDVNILERLIKFIFDNVGNIFSAKSIADYLRKNENIKLAPKTIYNYLKFLESVCLIYKVQREDLEGKRILSINEKYYSVDQGFNQAILGSNKAKISKIYENIVYLELLRLGYNVTIGKIKKNEIDFVCKKFDKTVYVQVSYSLYEEKTREREFKPLLAVNDNYPKYIITSEENDFSDLGIIHLNIIDFLTNGLNP